MSETWQSQYIILQMLPTHFLTNTKIFSLYLTPAFPIWWGQAPRIISTFLESYDFKGKRIAPFCTSHSSGIGSSDTNLHSLVDGGTEWKDGKRFAASTSEKEITEWLSELEIEPFTAEEKEKETARRTFDFEKKTVKLNSGYEIPLNGIGTYSLEGDTCVKSVSEALNCGVRLIDEMRRQII